VPDTPGTHRGFPSVGGQPGQYSVGEKVQFSGNDPHGIKYNSLRLAGPGP